MSASSGILPSPELVEAFRSAQDDTALRALAVVIEGDSQLVAGKRLERQGSAEEDYGLLEAQVDPKVPCFFLFRLDDGSWLLVVYVPDAAPVRQKMLYASSRAQLTRSLGDSYFSTSLHAHSPVDLTAAAYRAHQTHTSSSAPLTEREQEIAALKQAEGVEASGSTPRGGAFSVTQTDKGLAWEDAVSNAVREVGERKEGGVHITLDIKREALVLASQTTIDQLSIPVETPSYNLIAHPATFALVYCCPAKSPVKSRMVYSTALVGVQKRMQREYGIEPIKRLETSDPAEITKEWLDSELGPATPAGGVETAQSPPPAAGFARPKRPGGRGARKPDPTTALPAETTAGETESSLP